MEITLDKKALKIIRSSAEDAVEEGDTETLREDIYEAFSEDQIEQIDRRLEGSDFMEFLTDLLEDWSQDDADELLELEEPLEEPNELDELDEPEEEEEPDEPEDDEYEGAEYAGDDAADDDAAGSGRWR